MTEVQHGWAYSARFSLEKILIISYNSLWCKCLRLLISKKYEPSGIRFAFQKETPPQEMQERCETRPRGEPFPRFQ
jgi:hypothetical protein